MHSVTTAQPDIIPAVLYADAHEGIAFLERAFGFSRHLVVPGKGNEVAHCEMRLGNGMVMLGSPRDDERKWKLPAEVGGAVTSCIYVAVPDVDERFERAAAAGAVVYKAPVDTDYGSRDFTVFDPAGNAWSFGTYHPVASKPGGADGGKELPPEVYAATRYADARAAIAFLRDAFGFEEHFVVPGDDGKIVHSQLRFGSSLFMASSPNDTDFRLRPPAQVGGVVTQAQYVIVSDPDAHYARAKEAGAQIVSELRDEDYGSRGYQARDLEGNYWTFGTYRPAADAA